MSDEKRKIYLVSPDDGCSYKELDGRKITKLVFRSMDRNSLMKDNLYMKLLNTVKPLIDHGNQTSKVLQVQQEQPTDSTSINILRYHPKLPTEETLTSTMNYTVYPNGKCMKDTKSKINGKSDNKKITIMKNTQHAHTKMSKVGKGKGKSKEKLKSRQQADIKNPSENPLSIASPNLQLTNQKSESEIIEEKVQMEETRLLAENTRLSELLEELKSKEEKLSEIKSYQKERVTLTKLKQNQEMLYFYVGMKNIVIIDSMVGKLTDYFSSHESNYESCLHLEDQLAMTLMKLRRNYYMHDLAFRFRVSVSEADRVVFNIIVALHDIYYEKRLKDKPFPSVSESESSLPEQFHSFPNCRVVLECVKIGCEDPDNDSETEIFSSSKFDPKITLKGLLGISPSKSVLFASSLYEEPTSNADIFRDCGIDEKLDAEDLILADKSFDIQNFISDKLQLNIPRGCQLDEKKIRNLNSKARAFIGRTTMQHIRRFCILNRIPVFLNSIVSLVFQLCAALVNLQPTIHIEKNDSLE